MTELAKLITEAEDDERIGTIFMDCVRLSNQIKANDRADVTAWGDDGLWDKPWQTIPFARITIDAANLIGVFDEAYETGAIIVWGKNMPLDGIHGCPKGLRGLNEIVVRTQETWHKQPPYIAVVGEPHRNVYSIKPVWEL